MANIAVFTSGQEPKYIQSADTLAKDAQGNLLYLTAVPPSKDQAQAFAKPDVLINPDISPVSSIATRFWKRNGNLIEPMTAPEQQAIIDAENTAIKASIPEMIAAQWHTSVTKSNLSSTFVDVYNAAGYDGFPIYVDFRNRKYFAVVIFWNKLGTGVQSVRAVNNGNVLFDVEVVNGRNFFNYQDLPAWATGIKEIRLQCKSTINTDDPIFRGAYIALK